MCIRTLSRRAFLGTGLLTFALGCARPFLRPKGRRRFKGGIVGANSELGHALRDGRLPPPTENAQAGLVIIGGGIAGLSAAWQLRRKGWNDFLLLELESRPGGNA